MPTSKDTQHVSGQGDPADENTEIIARAQRVKAIEDRAERERQAVSVVRAVTSNGHSELARKQVRDLFRESKILSAADFDRLAREAVKVAPLASGPHPVNVSAEGFTYSAGRPHGSCSRCAMIPRGLYQGDRYAGMVPELHAQPVHGEGASRQSEYLLSKTAESGRISIPGEEIESGKWSFRLGLPRSADRRIGDALASVILYHLAAEAPEVPAFPSAELRDATGHLYVPVPECLPAGYLAVPKGLDDQAAAGAGRRIAEIAAANPKVALALGMAVDAPFVSATRRQPSWTKFYGPKRQGKTTALFLAASVWGKVSPPTPGPDQVVRSWDSTAKGAARFLGQLGILPAFFDESGTAEFTDADWARLIYGMTQGNSRMQAEVRGMGSRATPGWRGRLFVTGNDMICDGMDGGKFDGISARLLQFPAPFTRTPEECEELEELVRQWHGWLGPAVLAAYTPEEWTALLAEAGAALGMPAGGAARTIAKDLAGGIAGAMAADAVLGTGTMITDAATETAREYLDAHRGESRTAGQRMIAAVRESMTFHRSAWASQAAYEESSGPRDPRDGDAHVPGHGLDRDLSGFYDDNWVYVKAAAWREMAEAEGLGPTASLAELHAGAVLDVPPQDRKRGEWTSRAPRWAGRARCYKIRVTDVLGDDEDQAEAPAPDQAPAAPTPVLCSACGTPMKVITPGQTAHPGCEPEPEGWPADSIGGTVNRASGPQRPGQAPAAPAAPAAPVTRAEAPAPASVAPAQAQHPYADPAKRAAYDHAVTALADAEIGDHPERLRILAALEGQGKNAGPFTPTRARRAPWYQAPMPAVADDARMIPANWSRDYSGPVVTLDRSGAWVAAASSVSVVHGGYENTGPQEDDAPVRPGYYAVTAYPWTETGMPGPLGSVKPGTKVVVPAPRMALLRELARAGRWPDGTALDSWTGEPARLREWAQFVALLREHAITTYGRESDQYGAVKVAFGQAMGLLTGSWDRSQALPKRSWKCKARRPDWRHHIEDQAAVTLWRAADECLALAGEQLGPLALRNTDELVIPAAALDIVTSGQLPGRTRPPVRIDQLGVKLGTFKVKAEGEI